MAWRSLFLLVVGLELTVIAADLELLDLLWFPLLRYRYCLLYRRWCWTQPTERRTPVKFHKSPLSGVDISAINGKCDDCWAAIFGGIQ